MVPIIVRLSRGQNQQKRLKDQSELDIEPSEETTQPGPDQHHIPRPLRS